MPFLCESMLCYWHAAVPWCFAGKFSIYTKCTKQSFRWTRCSRYHCKDVHHCGKFWQQTNPPQLTINSLNFSHLFSAGRKWLLKKYFLSEENIFFQNPVTGLPPKFSSLHKKIELPKCWGLQSPPATRLVRLCVNYMQHVILIHNKQRL